MCFFVITIHITTDYRIQDGIISYHVLLGESFLRCCVPVFFMCTGYFMFSKAHSTFYMYKRLLLNLVLPTLAIILFWFIFNDFIENQKTLTECIRSLQPAAFVSLLKQLLNWDLSGIKNGFYLWFMISLIKIYIAYPVLKLLCVDLPDRNRTRRLVMVLCAIADLIFPTIEAMTNNTVMLYGYSIFCDYSFLYIFLGYELYLFFQRESTQMKWSLYGVVTYIVGSLSTYFASVFLDIKFDATFNEYFFNYNTIGVFIASVGFFMFIRNINVSNSTLENIITYCGRQAFTLYLVHYIVIRTLTCYGVISFLNASLPRPLFYVSASVLCYFVSLLISLLLYWIKE